MTAENFCYWLQGYIEIHTGKHATRLPELTVDQVDLIAKHLKLVFVHDIDPKMGGPDHQKKLDAIHGGNAIEMHPKDVVMRC